MNNNRITNILLILLLAFNLGFVGMMWMGHNKGHKRMHPDLGPPPTGDSMHNGRGGMFLAKQLDFTEDQQKQLEALRKSHFEKIGQLENAVARNEKNMMSALMGATIDSVKANVCADSIGMLKASIQRELFRHFEGIKKMCNPDQSRKFDDLVKDMSKEFPHHWDPHHGNNGMHHDTM
jgi:Spy/CpxP family protein refolding chaperone